MDLSRRDTRLHNLSTGVGCHWRSNVLFLSGYCILPEPSDRESATRIIPLAGRQFSRATFCQDLPGFDRSAAAHPSACDWISRHYVPQQPKTWRDNGFDSFLVNLFSLQGVAGGAYGSNGPLWTLSIELQFYIFYPLLLKVMSWLGTARTLGALVILGAVSYCALEPRGYLVFSSYYASWYLGVLVAEVEATGVFEDEMSSSRRRAAFRRTSLALLCAGCALYFASSYVAFQLWALAFASFLLDIRTRPTEYKGSLAAVLRWIGTFSFSLYIYSFAPRRANRVRDLPLRASVELGTVLRDADGRRRLFLSVLLGI